MKILFGNPDLLYYFKGVVIRWDGLRYWRLWERWTEDDLGSTVERWGLGPLFVDVWREYRGWR